MKRFTETTKWDDKWFRALSPAAKLFWDWVCSKCDQAGVIDPDFELASFQVGLPITSDILIHFNERIEIIPSGKLRIVKFIQFQYGKLSRQCKPHQPVFAALERHGLDPDAVPQNETFKESVDDYLRQRVIDRDGLFCAYYGKSISEHEAVIDHIVPRVKGGKATMDNLVVSCYRANSKKWDYSPEQFCEAAGLDKLVVFERLSKATGKSINDFYDTLPSRVKEKEKEKDTETDQEQETVKEAKKAKSEWIPTPEQIKINGWFARRDSTAWSDKEIKAFKAIPHQTILDGIQDMNGYYLSGHKTLRHDILTLLNNWTGEMDRAFKWESEKSKSGKIDLK